MIKPPDIDTDPGSSSKFQHNRNCTINNSFPIVINNKEVGFYSTLFPLGVLVLDNENNFRENTSREDFHHFRYIQQLGYA